MLLKRNDDTVYTTLQAPCDPDRGRLGLLKNHTHSGGFWNDGPSDCAAQITGNPINTYNIATTAMLLRDHLANYPPGDVTLEPKPTLTDVRAYRERTDPSVIWWSFFSPPHAFLDAPRSRYDENPLSPDQWREVFKVTAAVSTYVSPQILPSVDTPGLRERFARRAQEAPGLNLFGKPIWIPVEGPRSDREYSTVVVRLNALYWDTHDIDRIVLSRAPRVVMPEAGFDA
jgi:hypothetical protein